MTRITECASLTLVASDREEREDGRPVVGHTAQTQVGDVFKGQGGAVDEEKVIRPPLEFIVQARHIQHESFSLFGFSFSLLDTVDEVIPPVHFFGYS